MSLTGEGLFTGDSGFGVGVNFVGEGPLTGVNVVGEGLLTGDSPSCVKTSLWGEYNCDEEFILLVTIFVC